MHFLFFLILRCIAEEEIFEVEIKLKLTQMSSNSKAKSKKDILFQKNI